MTTEPSPRTEFSVADVLRSEPWEAYRATHSVPDFQHSAVRALSRCRTAALGGHKKKCACGFEKQAYNSCGNRNCPTCQGRLSKKWLAGRSENLLSVRYSHAMFGLHDGFNDLVPRNRKVIYSALLKAVINTLAAWGHRELGGQLWGLAVLHTWGQTMWFHPHVHVLTANGVLSEDGTEWRPFDTGFLAVHASLMQKEFGERFCAILRKADLVFEGKVKHLADKAVFAQFLEEQMQRPWSVHCKKAEGGPGQVLEYFAKHLHSVAIRNYQITNIADDGSVSFTHLDRNKLDDKGYPVKKVTTLTGEDFIGRFVRHILPKGFRKVRPFGLLSGRNKAEKIRAAREAILRAQLPVLSEGTSAGSVPVAGGVGVWRVENSVDATDATYGDGSQSFHGEGTSNDDGTGRLSHERVVRAPRSIAAPSAIPPTELGRNENGTESQALRAKPDWEMEEAEEPRKSTKWDPNRCPNCGGTMVKAGYIRRFAPQGGKRWM
ncbi:MAG: hypothetical protein HN976_33005 [Lentisphaerae bacterium]|nr:hypothetical protein [Lentisphaerota bacterium]MBT7059963.1 hypothetical protein [Lentisphaerota bacterium]